jgi:hypothetical protein
MVLKCDFIVQISILYKLSGNYIYHYIYLFTRQSLTDGGEVSPTPRPPFTPGRFLVLISVRG